MSHTEITSELADEQAALDELVEPLQAQQWTLDTPSARWSIADQIGHLTYFDNAAALAIEDPDAFAKHRDELFKSVTTESAADQVTLGDFRALSSAGQLSAWRDGRDRLARAAADTPLDARIEWYGPSMSLRSFLTARLMETWAHGQDVQDALVLAGVPFRPRPVTDRLRNIAQLGVITRPWSYKVRGLPVPDSEVRVTLSAPSGATWEWGSGDAVDSIEGPAEDFCLVVTQRRHRDDTDLEIVGNDALEWMSIAQAFAGSPTNGPAAGSVTPRREI